MATQEYIGSELELFALAKNWKSYLRENVRPFLGPQVLEVGAGLGGTTQVLCDGKCDRWLCLEPDEQLARQVEDLVAERQLPSCCEVLVGTLESLSDDEAFDTVLYIDVLEHIEDDAAELRRAASHLRPGGHLIVLSPAHQWLFTPFDRAIGHYRRYSKETISRLTPRELQLNRLRYLDAVGVIASSGNRVFLRSAMPTVQQIWIWDRWMVPLSRFVDSLLFHHVGKSVFAVWTKPAERSSRLAPVIQGQVKNDSLNGDEKL